MDSAQLENFKKFCGGMTLVRGRPSDMNKPETGKHLYQRCWAGVQKCCPKGQTDCKMTSNCFSLSTEELKNEMGEYAKEQAKKQ